MPTLTGTLGDDTLTGTSGNDIIDGLDGNDLISGGDGNDQITGGLGDDTLFGEGGDDFVGDVDGGNDVLHGGAGNDSVTLYHIEFNRTETALLTGDDGNDYITDWSYAAGSVSIDAGSGDDTVLLYSSSHSIDVGLGSGRDILSLEPFQPHWSLSNTVREVFDFETGAAGDSVLLYNLLSNYGEWDGKTNPFETGVIRLIQRGSDTVLQLSGLMSVADFQDLLIFRGKTVGSFLAENFGGFSPNGIAAAGFTLTGDATDNVLTGGYGVDVIDGLGGTDRLVGLAGNDTLRGGDGMDFIYAGYGDDRVEGGAGDDFIDMQHDGGSDVIDAGTGNDSIIIYRNFRD